MDDSPVKKEGSATTIAVIEPPPPKQSAGYKSWKKKYRKMRIVFDQKMHDGEELHKQEAKASALVKRLAVENDRLLELLLEINDSPQIPPEKRLDLSLPPPSDSKFPIVQLDRDDDRKNKQNALKKLEEMLNGKPHSSYNQAKEALPHVVVADLKGPDVDSYPADFLTAEDIDNYIFEVDRAIEPDNHFPTLAPRAHPSEQTPATHPQLNNPTSVTNWLRKHAPKVFLQDGEVHADVAEDGQDGPTSTKKPRGGKSAGERSSKNTARGKRQSAAAAAKSAAVAAAAAAAASAADVDANLEDEVEVGVTPVPKGKRKRDEDAGYKPRGSSSRPTKKKRKSEVEGTPSARKTKKEKEAAANKDD